MPDVSENRPIETDRDYRAGTATADPWARVSVVVVTHHSAAVIEPCLTALGAAAEVILVDNASDDGTPDIASRLRPDATVLRNAVGLGYGGGANRGLAVATREFVLLANPDSVVDTDALARLLAAADAFPDGALFGPLVRDRHGEIEPSHDVELFRRRDVASDPGMMPEGPCCAAYLSGAVTLLRRSAYRTVGAFDDRLFLYYEDDDYCMRIRAARLSSILVPDAVVTHVGGGSVRPSAHYYWEKFWHMAWSRLYIEEKYRGAAARRKLARAQLLRFAGKSIANTLTLRRAKAWRDLARLFGTLSYMLGIRASRSVASARPAAIAGAATAGRPA